MREYRKDELPQCKGCKGLDSPETCFVGPEDAPCGGTCYIWYEVTHDDAE